MERWTSHKERDFNITTSKSLSSLKVKEKEKLNEEEINSNNPNPVAEENKDSENKPVSDRHLDTVAKLKKRSERFKLPMPSEKDAMVIKKLESEALPSITRSEVATEAEVKHERPPRKRRWVGN